MGSGTGEGIHGTESCNDELTNPTFTRSWQAVHPTYGRLGRGYWGDSHAQSKERVSRYRVEREEAEAISYGKVVVSVSSSNWGPHAFDLQTDQWLDETPFQESAYI